jgi:1,4-alpha-glucan branching enzyme
MVSVQPSAASPEAVDLIIKFHSSTQEPVYISADATEWKPQQMQLQGNDAYEHVITVPRTTQKILYKFRIGDSNWVHDGTVPAGKYISLMS